MRLLNQRLPRLLNLLLLSAFWLLPQATAADKATKAEQRQAVRNGTIDLDTLKANRREEKVAAKAGAADANDPAARQLAKLRQRLDVTDDAEWSVIATRIAKVEELQRTLATRAAARGLATLDEKVKRNDRAGASANPEIDALRSAVTDRSTDAEIKARLARAHAAHLQNEALLEKAQTELRSILTVRQEAIAVMAGLLPP